MADFGETVALHCTATLDDGTTVIDTRAAQSPLTVRLGASDLPGAVEVAASNLLPGGRTQVSLTAAQAFGERDESLVQRIPASLLPDGGVQAAGKRIVLRTPAGAIDAKVLSADADGAVVDLNHPFAGHAAVFDIELVALVHESAIHRELHPAGCACGCDKLKAQIG